ncbi:MAG: hypothetical protein QMD11_08945, partial [Smithella sp.]|nr:hypothetical protein [Smithella sp.]
SCKRAGFFVETFLSGTVSGYRRAESMPQGKPAGTEIRQPPARGPEKSSTGVFARAAFLQRCFF